MSTEANGHFSMLQIPIGVGLCSGAGALAAVALANPVGAAGGAIMGGVGFLVGRPVEYISTKVFNTDKEDASLISRVVGAATGFFASVGATVAIASLLGVSITFGSACILSLVTTGIAVGVVLTVSLVAFAAIVTYQATRKEDSSRQVEGDSSAISMPRKQGGELEDMRRQVPSEA